ncbi:hypothetical protein [Bosea sp. (in: a-proteobacteria)]|uniref:hypothetical protein n=1 Tax=Bosea sp. (in: a-proteobacteria) TaxID=1871050 RepID=UPI001ACC0F1F|nr:hypothetical protein [Bosea sp. (in: a-proteobacteria)]MBN9438943.1 hypothetical protein [Bosea sp. (in: a-proteobacteria)]
MRSYLIAGSLTLACSSPLAAQERHPLVAKAMELGAANAIVSEKCEGWSLNPIVSTQLLLAIGIAGVTDQFEKITPSEIAAMAESSKAAFWTAENVGAQCAAAAAITMPNPIKEGETISVFVHKVP